MHLYARILLGRRGSKASPIPISRHWKFLHLKPLKILLLQIPLHWCPQPRTNNHHWFQLRPLTNQHQTSQLWQCYQSSPHQLLIPMINIAYFYIIISLHSLSNLTTHLFPPSQFHHSLSLFSRLICHLVGCFGPYPEFSLERIPRRQFYGLFYFLLLWFKMEVILVYFLVFEMMILDG